MEDLAGKLILCPPSSVRREGQIDALALEMAARWLPDATFISRQKAKTRRRAPGLIQLLVLVFRLDQAHDFRVRVPPRCQELLICVAAFRDIAGQGSRTRHSNMGEWIQG